jgi:hypothetical protein
LILKIVVQENEKIGDIDPGSDPSCCLKVSDKARTVCRGVLEAVKKLSNG